MSEAPPACVIGWPAHRSTAIHRFRLNAPGIAGDHIPAAAPPEKITTSQSDFPRNGCHITLIHKRAAFADVDTAEPAAEAAVIVDILWIDSGKSVGNSTNSMVFLANLDVPGKYRDKQPESAVIPGARGAARPVLHTNVHREVALIPLVDRTEACAEVEAEPFADAVRPTGRPLAERLLAIKTVGG